MADAVETWREFCELLKDAGAVLLRDDLRATDVDHARAAVGRLPRGAGRRAGLNDQPRGGGRAGCGRPRCLPAFRSRSVLSQ